MTRATVAKDKAARLAAQRHTPVADPAPPPEQPSGTPVEYERPKGAERKNIRVTLDLAPGLYDDFETWRRRAAQELGWGRVKSVDVMRELLRQLMAADSELSAQVVEVLRREGRR